MHLATRILSTLLTILGCSTLATARGEPPEINPDRAVIINTVIDRGNILPLGQKMLDLAHADSSAPIDLIINSPGGEVTTGFLFINQMEAVRAMGTPIRCFVPGVAASMAFQILVHCTERYSLSKAFLLWHRVRVSLGGGLFSSGVTLTAPAADALARDMASLDQVIHSELLASLDLSPADVSYHFENETLHVAENLHRIAPKFLTVYDAIPGLLEALTNETIPGGGKQREDRKIRFSDGQIIYIWRQ